MPDAIFQCFQENFEMTSNEYRYAVVRSLRNGPQQFLCVDIHAVSNSSCLCLQHTGAEFSNTQHKLPWISAYHTLRNIPMGKSVFLQGILQRDPTENWSFLSTTGKKQRQPVKSMSSWKKSLHQWNLLLTATNISMLSELQLTSRLCPWKMQPKCSQNPNPSYQKQKIVNIRQ